MADKPSVLFVCVHNAGRSQMAAALLTHLAGDRTAVRSAGAAPAETINPVAVAAMEEVGIDITAAHPNSLPPTLFRPTMRRSPWAAVTRALLSGGVLPRLETARSGRARPARRAGHYHSVTHRKELLHVTCAAGP
jgi:hypothetical protein